MTNTTGGDDMKYENKSFEELSNMHIADLREQKSCVLEALNEKRKERDFTIGQIMFYQQMLKDQS